MSKTCPGLFQFPVSCGTIGFDYFAKYCWTTRHSCIMLLYDLNKYWVRICPKKNWIVIEILGALFKNEESTHGDTGYAN